MKNSKEEEAGLATLARFYEAEKNYLDTNGEDFSAIAATLDPECVIYLPASLPYGGEWKGHTGFEAWMRAFAQQWSSLEVKNAELFLHGDVIVSRSHVYAIAKSNGRHIDWPLLQLFRIRGQKIVELHPFYWDTAALLAAMQDS